MPLSRRYIELHLYYTIFRWIFQYDGSLPEYSCPQFIKIQTQQSVKLFPLFLIEMINVGSFRSGHRSVFDVQGCFYNCFFNLIRVSLSIAIFTDAAVCFPYIVGCRITPICDIIPCNTRASSCVRYVPYASWNQP